MKNVYFLSDAHLVHLRQGIQVAQENGRPGRNAEAQHRQGKGAVRFPGREQAVQGYCPQGRPFSDECAVRDRR